MWVMGRVERMRVMGRAMVVVAEMEMATTMEMAAMEMVVVWAVVMEMEGVEMAATGVAVRARVAKGRQKGRRRVVVWARRRVVVWARWRVVVWVRQRVAVGVRVRVAVTEEEGPELVERATERVSSKA